RRSECLSAMGLAIAPRRRKRHRGPHGEWWLPYWSPGTGPPSWPYTVNIYSMRPARSTLGTDAIRHQNHVAGGALFVLVLLGLLAHSGRSYAQMPFYTDDTATTESGKFHVEVFEELDRLPL